MMTNGKLEEIRDLLKANVEAEGEKALRIVFVGHVDHGKSTLIGRLLHETDSVLPAKMQLVEEICRDRGTKFEYAFLLDALEEEQDQGITIDVAQVIFRTRRRAYRVMDAPGHKEFLKNMVSGASGADAAILLIDAEEGLKEQTKRHATLLSLLGIPSVIVAMNKMDLVGYRREVFEELKKAYSEHLTSLKLVPKAFIPVSAYVGDNLVSRTSQMSWYEGPTLIESLDSLEHRRPSEDKALRLPLQDVYKFDKKRILAGRVESGKIKTGDEVIFLPSGKSGVAKSIEKWNAPPQDVAVAGESIGMVLEDPLFVERGEILCHAVDRPKVSKQFKAHIFWLGERHLQKGGSYLVKLTTQEIEATVEELYRVINSSTLEEGPPGAQGVAKNEVAEIKLSFKKDIAYDLFDEIEPTGRFVLVDDRKVSGGGTIIRD